MKQPDFEKAKQLAKNARTSVSAEVFGKYHTKGAFQATVIPKGDDVKSRYELLQCEPPLFRIRDRLLQAFMFSALDDKEIEVVIDALDERKVAAGADVIVQGESGNELYVVEEG